MTYLIRGVWLLTGIHIPDFLDVGGYGNSVVVKVQSRGHHGKYRIHVVLLEVNHAALDILYMDNPPCLGYSYLLIRIAVYPPILVCIGHVCDGTKL